MIEALIAIGVIAITFLIGYLLSSDQPFDGEGYDA